MMADKPAVSHLRAVGLAILGFTLWVLCDAVIKFAGQSAIPNYEIVAFLGGFVSMFVWLYTLAKGATRALLPVHAGRLILRSLLDLGNCLFVVVALRHLTLTLFYILVFTSPMLVVILSRVFLRERLSWRQAAAILAGFVGVVIAVNPFGSKNAADWAGYGACFVCVLCFSSGIVWSRTLSQTERAESMTFVSGLVTAGAGFLWMLLDHAEPLNALIMTVLILMGLLCAIGNICVFVALKHTTAATVSHYHYTQLISGAIVAYVAFQEIPTRSMLVGASLIVVSGVYVAVPATRTPDVR